MFNTTEAKSEPETEPETETQAQPQPGPVTHPILGELVVVPPELEAQAVVARMRHWHSSLKPWNLYECWLLLDVARETIRLERIHQKEILLRHDQAQRARLSWDDDQQDAAEAFAENLNRWPAQTIAKLRRTPHGCQAIARRWEILLNTLNARGIWSAAERLMALNLLNVPRDLRDAITPLDAPEGTDPVPHMRALAETELQRHRALVQTLAPLDEADRQAQIVGLGPDTPALADLRKEERAANRSLSWCRAQGKWTRLDPRPPDRNDLPAYQPPKPRPQVEDPEPDSNESDQDPTPTAWNAAKSASNTSPPGVGKSSDPRRASPPGKSRRRQA